MYTTTKLVNLRIASNKMKKSLLCLLLMLLCGHIKAQDLHPYERLVTEEVLFDRVSWLADDANRGRASGTSGKACAEQFISRHFRKLGMKPYNWYYTQSFRYRDSIILRNVIGVVTASKPSSEYVIVSAHYDHLGEIDGRIFNGADDNASGVAVLLSLAEMFSGMKADGTGPEKNIIFIAFDGKELSMAGSKYFVKHLDIPASKVTAAVNIDIIGTGLVPPGKSSDYMIAIGENRLRPDYRNLLKYVCRRPELNLDFHPDFYGSRNFTKVVYENGDHWSFARKGIPAVFITSGFHQYTYKTGDDTEIINFPLLRKRTLAIYHYINLLCH